MMNEKTVLPVKALFNENGDIETHKRKMIGGNTTNLNDFNNMKYAWASDWSGYEQFLDPRRNKYERRYSRLQKIVAA